MQMYTYKFTEIYTPHTYADTHFSNSINWRGKILHCHLGICITHYFILYILCPHNYKYEPSRYITSTFILIVETVLSTSITFKKCIYVSLKVHTRVYIISS